MIIYLPITISIILLITAICIRKHHPLLTVLICYASGIFAGIISLILFFASLQHVQSFNFETGAGSLQQAGAVLALAGVNMVAGMGFTVTYACSSFRKIKYQEIDEIDQYLIQMNLMPVQRKNRRKYLKDRKQQRQSRRSMQEHTSDYQYIDKKSESFDKVIEQIHRICDIYNTDEIPKAVSALAWETAKKNNPQLNWEKPTVFMTKAVYQDIRTLYEIIEEYGEMRE